MRPRSIRTRLTVWYATLLGVSLAAFASSVYLALGRYLEGTLAHALEGQARGIAETFLGSVSTTGDDYVIEEIEEHYAPEINGRFVRVVQETAAGRRVLYKSGPPRDGSFRPAEIPLPSAQAAGTVREHVAASTEMVLHRLPFRGGDGNLFLVEVGAPYGPVRSVLEGLLSSFALGLPALMLAAALGGFVVARRALRPVERLTRVAERISSRNLRERLPVPDTGDELERLSLALNRMIERLEEALQHATRFSADASHELRTPLTVLRGELEATAARRDLPSDAREALASALDETERLSRIVEALLALARLDAGEARIDETVVDLGVLTAGTSEQMRLLAEDKGLRFRVEPSAEVKVMGDPSRLKQVVVNLLDNAIKYTPAGGVVRVAVACRNGDAVLEVADSGPGIPAEALPHVFERFYRADKVRSREMGGVGLGLSIAQSIAAAHGGRIEVESREGQGAIFRLVLPGTTNPQRASSPAPERAARGGARQGT